MRACDAQARHIFLSPPNPRILRYNNRSRNLTLTLVDSLHTHLTALGIWKDIVSQWLRNKKMALPKSHGS